MGLFVCDKCNTIENTALGWYSCRNKNQRMLGKEYPNGEAYCSACIPENYADGSEIKNSGWHGDFSKDIATPEEVLKLYKEDRLSMTNAAKKILKENYNI